ncbi:hypothetical protein [Hyphomicrobium sp. DY-1]|uniref:hypothetical protein n=1 Tax=Hyphomicrobium sp. DY-1 TaxID=3075650 RepID=UPI0039C3DD97
MLIEREIAMQTLLSAKRILIVKGSLLAAKALEAVLADRGAKVVLATNIISAFSLLERQEFDAAVIDKGLHNEAFDLCAEMKMMGIPYVLADAPHELQKLAAQKRSALDVSKQLEERIMSGRLDVTFGSRLADARFPSARGSSSMAVIEQRGFGRQTSDAVNRT